MKFCREEIFSSLVMNNKTTMISLGIKNLIQKNDRQMLYRDKCQDEFLLCRCGEIHWHSENTLRVYCWSPKAIKKAQNSGLELAFIPTDDPFYVFDVDRRFLQKIMTFLGRSKKRIARNSDRLRQLEDRLGHKILPYSPGLHWY
jgi:hypothetical protein